MLLLCAQKDAEMEILGKRLPENTHSDNYNSNVTFLGNKGDITGPLTYVTLSTYGNGNEWSWASIQAALVSTPHSSTPKAFTEQHTSV